MSSARGLRLLKAIEVYRKKVPYAYDSSTILNKIHIASMSQGCAKGSFTVDISMCNSGGTLHGGYIASVIDCLSFFSVMSDSNGKISWTVNLNIDYMKTAKIGEKVTVQTKLLRSGNTPEMETSLNDESGAIVARGRTNFKVASESLQKFVKEQLRFDGYEN